MITPGEVLFGLIIIAVIIDLFLIIRPSVTRDQSGKVLAFVGILLLPSLVGFTALQEHMENSKKTEFCLSCHVMENYGKSLYVDDKEFIPAVHFQNHRIPHEMACFTCHTEYTMYGDYAAKIRGLRHLYYQYIGGIPDTIKLYSKYNNRECLHCHEGARSFEEQSVHKQTPVFMDSLKQNQISCMTSGCHDVTHNVKEIGKQTFWKPFSKKDWPAWMLRDAAQTPATQPTAIAPQPTDSGKSKGTSSATSAASDSSTH